ncbi:hypothetical protein CYLTODRAFT_419150 [Cylindrobasidium torrendii FP15055 ss-10]|uniref:DUF6699 domain-containing protein n=1 Tax=Cylindrobasidium torrendii FP15055 ss-10 TaxID=1314674 RepID=A0A0D7BKZ3_9AGAR|nr:hypothetical protein CYLTODRAFT_419150 [Cylindrobasidium torrendii FP15055 ss-10]
MRESIDRIVSKFTDVHAASSYFQRQAVPFTLGEIIVVHDLLPWEIKIRANASGISVGRVLQKISDALNVGLLPQDIENCKIHDAIRQTIEVAAARRSGGRRKDYRRVDFLGESYMFAGLEQIKDNVFALQSSKP